MKILVSAPHPDDEVLGAGGTILRRKSEGCDVAWLILTSMSEDAGWAGDTVRKRKSEIEKINALFGFDQTFILDFPPAQLDIVPVSQLVGAVSEVFRSFQPEEVYVPHRGDAHTDHHVAFDAVTSCTKWFRHPYVKRVLAYETPSETDFGLKKEAAFWPNVYVNIDAFLERKLAAMKIYESETGEFPFPRSDEAIRALATLRGAASGFGAAEAFELLLERS